MVVLAAILLLLSPWSAWVERPVRGPAHWQGLVGYVVLLLVVLLVLAWARRKPSLTFLVGVFAVGLAGWFLLDTAWVDPRFWELLDEHRQFRDMARFSSRFLPANRGVEIELLRELRPEGAWPLLAAGVHFMRAGWWLCVAGGVAAIVGAWYRKRPRGRILLASMLIVAAFLASPWLVHLRAAALTSVGDSDFATGAYELALQSYQQAMRVSPRALTDESLYERMGAALRQLGVTGHPSAQFAAGLELLRKGESGAGIESLVGAERSARGPFVSIIRSRIARYYTETGLAAYERGDLAEAVIVWDKALQVDRSQVAAAFFLGRAYYDQGRCEASSAMIRTVVSETGNPVLCADALANLGDALFCLGDSAGAREAYRRSSRLDSKLNYRAGRSLGGT